DFAQPNRGWFNIDANDTNGFSVDFRDNATYPTINFGVDVSNPANFEYGPGLPDGTVKGTWSETKADRLTRIKTFNINGEWTAAEGVEVVGGGQYRQSYYRAHSLRLDPARQAIQEVLPRSSLAALTLQVTDLDKLLGHGAPASWTAADRDKFRQAIGFDDSWLCGIECGNGPQGVRETTVSSFAMLKVDWGDILPIPVQSDVGVRYVHTNQYSFGYIPVANPPGSYFLTSGQLAEVRRNYDDWLPSANVAAELTPDLMLRLSATKVMARPDLEPLIPDSGVDAVGRRGTIANPNLGAIHATTYDAALEWYFAPGSLLSIAYFRKNISTYIQSISSLIPFDQLGLPVELLANSQTEPHELFTINRLTSTPGGTLEGVEIYAQAPLDFLPGALSNFGLLASLTFVRSKINYILQSANGVPTLTTTADLLGLSRRSASGTFYYEDDRFSARLTGNYRSRYIRTIPSGAADSNYIANHPTFYLDFQTSFRISPQLKLLVEGQNLTNEDNVQYIDSVRQDSLFALESGRTFTIGINFLL
ncbi:MAG TPA: TonB-dependent receptor, partial [Planctomycetaceae bacterium]|nr:TonB-dependent receptor [Planctomycetaceae bacterium]